MDKLRWHMWQFSSTLTIQPKGKIIRSRCSVSYSWQHNHNIKIRVISCNCHINISSIIYICLALSLLFLCFLLHDLSVCFCIFVLLWTVESFPFMFWHWCIINLNEPPSSFLLPPRYCGLGAGSIPLRAIVNKNQCEMRGLFMSLVNHYWIGDVQDCQGVSIPQNVAFLTILLTSLF